MMDEEDADEPAPDQARPHACPTLRNNAAEDGWDHQAQRHPQRKQCARHPERTARGQVFGISVEVRRISVEEPANLCVPEPSQEAQNARTTMLRRVRIVWSITVLMMPTVHADPFQQWSLDRH